MSLFGQRKIIVEYDRSRIAKGFLAAIVVFGIFVVGYDQGQISSVVKGSDEAFEMKYLYEVTHDMGHAAGFPCH